MNIKKVIACIAACCITASAMQINTIKFMDSTLETIAADSTNGTCESLNYEKYSNHIEISGCDESAEKVEIPAEIDGLPVTSINYAAFQGCSNLTSITIPDSVTYIDDVAFYGCSGLKSITIPNGVTYIGVGAFDGCSGLTSITIPDSVTYISPEAFYGCSGLTSITIPDSVTHIGDVAFYGCSGLTSIMIPNSITSIGSHAFAYCFSLRSIIIPDSVTYIGGNVFSGTPWLEAKQKENPLVVVNNILIDGETCEGDVVISDSVTSICDRAFDGCYSLTSIKIPDSVTSIGYDVFYGCSGLTSITIPDSVTSIGSYTFAYCSSLRSITIPDSVTYIGGNVFSGTPWLEAKQKENPLVVVNNILIDGETCEGNIVIPDSVTSIGWYAFDGCSGLTSVTIPDSVTSIGVGAFARCSGLESVTILNPDCEISDYSDTICNGYNDDNNEYYFNGTIRGCSGSTAQAYAEKCEYNFEAIDESGIPESITYEKYSDHIEITGCDKSATEVVIPTEIDGLPVTSIIEGAFYVYYGLKSITIPDSVTSIGEFAFYGCSSLISITILNPDCEINDDSSTICNGFDNNYYFNGTIKGYENSTAQAYAEKYGYNFEAIGEIENPETLLGDANCDGEVSVADATLVLQYCGNKDKYKLSEQGIINADVDGTAGISAVDALRIQQYDASIIESF